MGSYIGCVRVMTETFYDEAGAVTEVIVRQDHLIQDSENPELQAWQEGDPGGDLSTGTARTAATTAAQREQWLADAQRAAGITC